MSKAVSAWKAWREQTHIETESERLGDILCAEVEKMKDALEEVVLISSQQQNGNLYNDTAGGWEMAFDDAVDAARKALND